MHQRAVPPDVEAEVVAMRPRRLAPIEPCQPVLRAPRHVMHMRHRMQAPRVVRGKVHALSAGAFCGGIVAGFLEREGVTAKDIAPRRVVVPDRQDQFDRPPHVQRAAHDEVDRLHQLHRQRVARMRRHHRLDARGGAGRAARQPVGQRLDKRGFTCGAGLRCPRRNECLLRDHNHLGPPEHQARQPADRLPQRKVGCCRQHRIQIRSGCSGMRQDAKDDPVPATDQAVGQRGWHPAQVIWQQHGQFPLLTGTSRREAWRPHSVSKSMQLLSALQQAVSISFSSQGRESLRRHRRRNVCRSGPQAG